MEEHATISGATASTDAAAIPRGRRARRVLWSSVGVTVFLGLAGLVQPWRATPAPDELFDLALASVEQSDLQDADRAARALAKHPEYDSHVRFLGGVALLRSGRPEEALQRFASLSPDGRLRQPLLLYTAQALHATNRVSEAELLLRTLVQERPNSPEAHRWLGILYYDLGAYDSAILHLQQLSKLAPEDYRPLRLIGLIHRDVGEDQEAVANYYEALKCSPEETDRREILQDLAESLVTLRRYEEAREVIGRAPPTPILETLAAEVYWSEGQTKAALERLQNARSLDPNQRAALLLEARIRAAQGNSPKALELLQQAVHLHPHDSECRYQLSLALRDAGLSEKAEVELAAWNRLTDRTRRLRELNMQAIRHPHDVAVREQLAEISEELGKHELAAMWRRTADGLRTGTPDHRTSAALSGSSTSLGF